MAARGRMRENQRGRMRENQRGRMRENQRGRMATAARTGIIWVVAAKTTKVVTTTMTTTTMTMTTTMASLLACWRCYAVASAYEWVIFQ
jgi:hypothetical protein